MTQAASNLALRFGDGTEGHASAWQGSVLTAVSERAYAPGRPLELTLRFGDGEVLVRGKAIGSKRRSEDQRFDVRVRLVDLKRDDRARLVEALQSAPSPPAVRSTT